MLRTIVIAGVVGAAFLIPASAGAKDEAPKKTTSTAVLVPASTLKWADAPDAAGVKIAPVKGDPAKGPSVFFIKLPAGYSVPLHHHTPDHFGLIVSGTMVFNVDGQDQSLPAGSYFSFTGKKQHTTKCADGADCVIFADTRGKWDVVPEKPAKK